MSLEIEKTRNTVLCFEPDPAWDWMGAMSQSVGYLACFATDVGDSNSLSFGEVGWQSLGCEIRASRKVMMYPLRRKESRGIRYSVS
jgi:hypothetical protein